ncbi:MAG: leucine-rich repeat protein [Clostridia bacterium]
MNKQKNLKKEKGITLIALVVTIVILLILAGISINAVLGENGLITKAKETKIAQAHAQVKDAIALLYVDYQLEALTGTSTTSFLDYLISKGVTDSNGIVDVETLLGSTLDYGNGTGTSDVYKVENVDGIYQLNYYDENGNGTVLDTYGGDVASGPIDRTALKFLVNSGEDGVVALPVAKDAYGEGGYEVDWGDGTTGLDSTSLTTTGMPHTYEESNKEYVVTITGVCVSIQRELVGVTRHKIIEVLQWGETGLEIIDLSFCSNLRKIANPTANSFVNVTSFGATFSGCTSLTSIPANLFANCPNVTSFGATFSGCTSLTSIPANLFSNCLNATYFADTFSGCTSLTSIPEYLFADCRNATRFDRTFESCIGITNIPADLFANCPNVTNFSNTFSGCTSLGSIPANLFANCPNVTSFYCTFYDCTGLTGNASELWERVPDGETNGYIGIPDGNACFYGCTNLNNYEQIPEYWKAVPEV